MNILVTGGAGYIGSVVVEELIRQGDRVTVYDNLYQGHRAAVHAQAEFVHGDLADREAFTLNSLLLTCRGLAYQYGHFLLSFLFFQYLVPAMSAWAMRPFSPSW